MGRNLSSEGKRHHRHPIPTWARRTSIIDGSAKLIPKGSDFVFELHYTATGKPETDVSRVGLVLMKTAPLTRYYTSPGTPSAFNLVIPPHESNVEVVSESTVGADMKLVYIQPHAHLRGKDFELRLVYPTGEKQTVFKAKFDFNWQLGYDLAKPIVLPKGTKMILIAHYDNSANNPFNPDPEKEVRWGPQNWDEMQGVFLGLVFPVTTDISQVLQASGPEPVAGTSNWRPDAGLRYSQTSTFKGGSPVRIAIIPVDGRLLSVLSGSGDGSGGRRFHL